jgi:hypothetical protein
VVGEFKSHQRNVYTRQPQGHYGRADGTYQSIMVRESWILDRTLDGKPEGARNPDRERQFNDWKKLLREIPPKRPGGWVIPRKRTLQPA